MTNLENNDQTMTEETGIPEVRLSPNGEKVALSEVSIVFGDDGDDTIEGALNAQEPGSTLFGNTGNDYIRSRGIGDRVFGGRGDDTIVNDNGKALIYGDLGNDFLVAKDSNTTLFGGRSFGETTAEEGKNILLSLGGKNILKGGGGNDSLVGEAGGDTMAGNDGDDTITSGPGGRSYLFGNKGADRLISRADDNPDTLFGGQDNDTLLVEGKADAPLLFGGVGNDVLKVTNASVNDAILVGDVNPDGSFGGSDGDEGNNYLFVEGGKGHQLFGNAGNDTLALGVNVTASVSMYGGRGDDYIFGGSDASYDALKIFGGRGDDTILFNAEKGSGLSNSVIWGDNEFSSDGFGDNIIKVRGSSNTLRGGNDNATTENAGKNFIQAIAVNLEERGSTNNILIGGAGNDTIDAGSSGAGDTLNGGPAGDNTYIFGPGQKIVQDTVGINTYFGVKADQDDAVTVTSRDIIGGAANFFITGDQSNVQTLGTGGIITTDSDKRQVLTVDNATGITKTGGGNDNLTFDNVSGSVDAGAGNDEINISGSVSGVVDGGAGDDTIRVNGSDGVTEGGVILGGEGDDYLFAAVIQAGGLMDGQDGADTLAVNKLFGVVKGGGLGKNVFGIDSVFGGAEIFTGAGDEHVILSAVGSAPDGAPNEGVIIIKGGEGDNRLGVSYDPEDLTTFDGTNTAKISLQGGAGADVLQGSPYGGDTLEGGAGNDILYGGKSRILSENLFTSTGGSALVANALSIGDGDVLIGGAGNDKFIFMGTNETGAVQGALTNNTLTELGDVPGEFEVVISVGTDGQLGRGNTIPEEGGTGFISAAFNVDTLTDFRVGEDRIFLNTNGPAAFETLGTATTVNIFSSNPGSDSGDGFLFGRLTTEGGSSGFTFASGGTNIYDGGFQFNFAVGQEGSTGLDADAWGAVSGTGILFDERTGGLYLSTAGSTADLIAVLPTGANITESTTLGELITYQDLSFADLSGVNLF
ncbi:MAG: hypothetical protein JJU32_17770 [Phormidium sp. BM_Day4_Bin.17]|nr:hypothetical protein [Phormidium sp. BM_Day4_Bin.17]UCJ12674.1 MAG: hypothetical protein JWS08_02325 [Phormidium sp. PBR-2020]